MIACPSCGYPNDEQEHRCERCGRRFEASAAHPLGAAALWPDPDFELEDDDGGAAPHMGTSPAGYDEPASAEAVADAPHGVGAVVSPGTETIAAAARPPVPLGAGWESSLTETSSQEWRLEVSRRVERFRQRREAQLNLTLDFGDIEDAISFPEVPRDRPTSALRPAKVIRLEEIPGARVVPSPSPVRHKEEPSAAIPTPARPWEPRPPTRLEQPQPPVARAPAPSVRPPGPQPALGPDRRAGGNAGSKSAVAPAAQASLEFPARPLFLEEIEAPVAPLAARVIAGTLDAAVLALGYALFFAAYTLLGGKFAFERYALAALGCGVILVALTYLFLFLYHGRATPGMQWVGLRLVDFDGAPAGREQRLLRIVSLIASAAAIGLGFIWAAMDEEGLSWHDRVSRTCLTLSDSDLRRRPPPV